MTYQINERIKRPQGWRHLADTTPRSFRKNAVAHAVSSLGDVCSPGSGVELCRVSPCGEPETPLTVIELGPRGGAVTRTPHDFDRGFVETTLVGSTMASV